jgi:hypothetical protein
MSWSPFGDDRWSSSVVTSDKPQKWAGIEAKSYKIPNEFSVEWATPNNARQRALSEEYDRE